ncbi:hypothetical protein MRX96_013928 [Rhipicephalus microplus]
MEASSVVILRGRVGAPLHVLRALTQGQRKPSTSRLGANSLRPETGDPNDEPDRKKRRRVWLRGREKAQQRASPVSPENNSAPSREDAGFLRRPRRRPARRAPGRPDTSRDGGTLAVANAEGQHRVVTGRQLLYVFLVSPHAVGGAERIFVRGSPDGAGRGSRHDPFYVRTVVRFHSTWLVSPSCGSARGRRELVGRLTSALAVSPGLTSFPWLGYSMR